MGHRQFITADSATRDRVERALTEAFNAVRPDLDLDGETAIARRVAETAKRSEAVKTGRSPELRARKNAEIQALADQGLTRAEVAERIGMRIGAFYNYISRHKIRFGATQ